MWLSILGGALFNFWLTLFTVSIVMYCNQKRERERERKGKGKKRLNYIECHFIFFMQNYIHTNKKKNPHIKFIYVYSVLQLGPQRRILYQLV